MENTTPTYVAGALFMKAHRLLRQHVADCLHRYDLIATTWTMLGTIEAASNSIRSSELAAQLNVKPPLITIMADELIDRGLISRITHPIDKRAKLLSVTPTGKKFIKKVEQDMQVCLDHLINGASNPDLKIFQNVLETIITNAEVKK